MCCIGTLFLTFPILGGMFQSGLKISDISADILSIYQISVRFEAILTIDNRLVKVSRKCR